MSTIVKKNQTYFWVRMSPVWYWHKGLLTAKLGRHDHPPSNHPSIYYIIISSFRLWKINTKINITQKKGNWKVLQRSMRRNFWDPTISLMYLRLWSEELGYPIRRGGSILSDIVGLQRFTRSSSRSNMESFVHWHFPKRCHSLNSNQQKFEDACFRTDFVQAN